MPPTIRLRLHIEGTVQGVWYRKHAAEEALRLGLTGWVRNLPDGGVEAAAEGPPDAVDRFVAWCRSGPPRGGVTRVTVRSEPPEQGTGFPILR